MKLDIRILVSPEEMTDVEKLQHDVWGEGEIVPAHMLLATIRNGGLLLGAYNDDTMMGFVYGFLGYYKSEGKTLFKHASHMLAIHPDYRGQNLGYTLKRAQWQLVRTQGLDLITWTYDPLLSINAHLNITQLGGICSTYIEDYYGPMKDKLNAGTASDRFMVELWVHSNRTKNRMSRSKRPNLDLGHYFSAGAEIINPTKIGADGWPRPPQIPWIMESIQSEDPQTSPVELPRPKAAPVYLLEIPADFYGLKNAHPELAHTWRMHTRALFQNLFGRGYLITDFVHLRASGNQARSFYVLSDGGSTLG